MLDFLCGFRRLSLKLIVSTLGSHVTSDFFVNQACYSVLYFPSP